MLMIQTSEIYILIRRSNICRKKTIKWQHVALNVTLILLESVSIIDFIKCNRRMATSTKMLGIEFQLVG
jgi:uncharacterized membrane protein